MYKKIIAIILLITISMLAIGIDRVPEITVSETEVVQLDTNVVDPDGDNISFEYESPLNNTGGWQTTYDDAGDYLTKMFVSDGQNLVEQDILIRVLNVNRVPVIEDLKPDESEIVIEETDSIKFGIDAVDFDGDELNYSWFVNGIDVGVHEDKYKLSTDYNSEGVYEIIASVYDHINVSTESWNVIVQNKNRKPVFNFPETLEVSETEIIDFRKYVIDPDGDNFTLEVKEPVDSASTWQTDFEDAGAYTIKVVASDGQDSNDIYVDVIVNDVNRKPSINNIQDLLFTENKNMEYIFDVVDEDKEFASVYSNNLPTGAIIENNVLKWKPSFDTVISENFFVKLQNGLIMLPVEVTVDDLIDNQTYKFNIIVRNTNQEPEFGNMNDVIVNERDYVIISPNVSDADSQHISFEYKGFMDDEKYLTTFEDSGEHFVTIIASDGESSVLKELNIFVNNVNRAPTYKSFKVLKVNEGEELSFKLKYDDLDYDLIKVDYSALPDSATFVDGELKWIPAYDTVHNANLTYKDFVITFSYNDGTYTVYDNVTIRVNDKNLKPEVKKIFPQNDVTVKKNDIVNFAIDVYDFDLDNVTIKWEVGFFQNIYGTTNHAIKFTKTGSKTVTATINDGTVTKKVKWTVKVVE